MFRNTTKSFLLWVWTIRRIQSHWTGGKRDGHWYERNEIAQPELNWNFCVTCWVRSQSRISRTRCEETRATPRVCQFQAWVPRTSRSLNPTPRLHRTSSNPNFGEQSNDQCTPHIPPATEKCHSFYYMWFSLNGTETLYCNLVGSGFEVK